MNNNKEQIIAGTCLLLSVSKADDIIESEEIQIILQGGQQGRVVLNHKE